MIRSKLAQVGLVFTLLLSISTGAVYAAVPSFSFSPSSTSVPSNTDFSIDVVIDTAGKGISGAGAKITYDRNYISGVSIVTSDLFADYPAAIIDNDNGLITISGIAASASDIFVGNDTFATITFHSNNPGNTTVGFQFTPGSTTDSNLAVMSDVGDILEHAGTLSLAITGEQAGSGSLDNTSNNSNNSNNSSSTTQASSSSSIKSAITKAFKTLAAAVGLGDVTDKYAATRDGRPVTTTVTQDPLGPITQQPPITDASSNQPVTDVTAVKNTRTALFALVIFIIVGLILAVIVLMRRLKHASTGAPAQPDQWTGQVKTPTMKPTATTTSEPKTPFQPL